MRSFHNPSPCFEARIRFPLRFFLSSRFDVWAIVPTPEKLANVLGVVRLVETDVLMPAAVWLRTFDRDAVEGCFKQSNVVRVRTAYFNPQRHAATIGKHRSLSSQFATIGRVFAGFFPHPVATWSLPRPRFANSTGCPVFRRTPRALPSTSFERRLLSPTLESNDVRYSPSHTHSARPSIGNRSATHKRYRRQHFANRFVVDHLRGSSDSVATTVSSAATFHREDAKRTASVVLPLETPPCWHKMSEKSPSVRTRIVNSSVLG